MIAFARESIAEAWDDGIPFMREYHAEVGTLPSDPFSPDKERYLKLDPVSRLYTARADRQLLGWGFFILMPHILYPHLTFAFQDMIFIRKAFRGPAAVRFLRWQDEQLFQDHVDVIDRHSVPSAPHDRLLRHIGYSERATHFIRRAPCAQA